MTGLPQPRRAALAFIFVTVALDMLALGIVIPVLPKLVLSFLDGDTQRAARVYGLFGTVWALMQFVFSPVQGALSDSFGRRRVVLLSNVGLGLDYVLMAASPTIGWLFLGRIVSGITAASFSTAGAYIADVTPPEKRAAGFGMIGVAFGLGFVLGPAIGGLLGGFSPRLPFWVAAGASLLNALYGFFVLPESLPKENRMPFSWRRANPLGSLALLRSHQGLLGLSLVNFLGDVAHSALPAVFALYAGYRYNWDTRMIGLTLAGVGVSSAIVQGALVPFAARFGDRRVLVAGLVFGAAGFALYGFATTGTVFWLGIPVMGLWGLSGPAAQSLMTARTSPSEQGQLQGANSSIMGIAGLFGPGLFTLTFAAFIGKDAPAHLPGAPFLLAGLMLVLAAAVAVVVTRSSAAATLSPVRPTSTRSGAR
ncbi:MAG TPA: TCR/Tet family MFS transporter [Polyangiaceae bacterium]|jgi:DHA1 family tetracycline resistance protein-like MFS transporter|nr:TCR/Tet family MFS transporter [Polyangiaceae bacterium]